MTIYLYVKSDSNSFQLDKVSRFFTEGNLLRIIYINGNEEFYPLCEIFKIKRELK